VTGDEMLMRERIGGRIGVGQALNR